jgi:Fe-S-cluster-containing dehydrogenase component
MLNTTREKNPAAEDERMICATCKEGIVLKALEKESPLAQYAIAKDREKCIGCQMCMIDCAAHHTDAKHTPVVYPQAWDLLPEARLFGEEGGAAQKCDMCAERLQAGIDPVCVQICPRGALSVKLPDERKRLFKLISN